MTIRIKIFRPFLVLEPKLYRSTKNLYRCLSGHNRQFKAVTRDVPKANFKIMKVDSPQFRSCLTEEVLQLKKLFDSKGYEIRIVGGAVRDLLLGRRPEDLDFATPALPQEMKDMFIENDIRLINSNGERHGTITARIGERNFEVTTLRVDKRTDGRHAEVEYTKDWLLDANRRDLTINAMYLDFDGTLFDYFNGFQDLLKRRIVFVGDPNDRIQEDYLRILRYFRFYGRVAEVPDNHDEDVIKAIIANVEGLKQISGERLWTELSKILTGRFAADMLQKILTCNIGPNIGLPEKHNETEFKVVCERLRTRGIKVMPITFLSSVVHDCDELTNFYARIKPSCAVRDLGFFIVKYRDAVINEMPLRYYQNLIIQNKPQAQAISFVHELLRYKGELELLKKLEEWTVPPCPVNGNMLKSKGVTGKMVGIVLDKLRNIWVLHDFNITAEELLKHIPDEAMDPMSDDSRRRPQIEKKRRKK